MLVKPESTLHSNWPLADALSSTTDELAKIKDAFKALVDPNNLGVTMKIIGDKYDPEQLQVGENEANRKHCNEIWKWIGHTALVAISQKWAANLKGQLDGEVMDVHSVVRKTVTVSDEAFACFVLEYHAGRWAAASQTGQPGRVTGAGVFNNQLHKWAQW